MKIRQAIIWSVLIGIVTVGTLLWLWSRHQTAEARIMARGTIALQQGDVKQAVEFFRDAHQRYPKSYSPTYWLAEAELRSGRTDEARRLAQEAARLDAKKVEPYTLQARAFRSDAAKKYEGLLRVASESEYLAAETLLSQAQKVLDLVKPITGKDESEVLAERGFCYGTLSRLEQWKADSLKDEANHAAAADPAQAAELRKRAADCTRKRAEAADQALVSLLASLRLQKKNARAAEAAEELALGMGKSGVALEAYEMLASVNAVSERAAIQAAQGLISRALAPVLSEDWKASQRAMDILEAFIKDHPKTVEARVALARVLIARGERDAAGKVVARILEIAPANQMGLMLKGQLLLATGKAAEAKTILQPLSTAMRDSIPCKLLLAEVQRQLGYPQVERQLYREVLDLDPGNADAHLALVQELLAEGQTAAAESQLAAAIHAAPENERIVRFAVVYALDRGKKAEALELLDRTSKRTDLPRGMRETLADMYVRAGQPDRAEEVIRQVGPGEAADAGVRQKFVLASMAIARGRVDEGRRMLQELVAANPKWAQGYLGLARALMLENRSEDAAAAVRRALEADPRDPSVRLAAAEVFARGGMLDEAKSLCDKLLAEAPNNQTALTLAARIDLLQQDYDSAARRIDALNALTGQKTQDWLIQAELAYRQGQYDKCVEICGDKNELAALWLASTALTRMGKGEEAAQKLVRLIELQPEFGQAYDRLVQTWLAIDTPAGAMERLKTLKNGRPVPLVLSRGAILVAMGKIDEAIAIYDAILKSTAVASSPAASRLLRGALATCYRMKNDPANELKQYEAIAAAKDTHIAGELQIYQLYRRTNRPEQATEVLDRLSRGAGEDESGIPLRQRLAACYAELGQPDKAVAELNRAIAVRPDLPQLVSEKVRVYVVAGKLDDALNTTNEGLQRWPDDVQLLKALADVQTARHDYGAALAALDHMAAAGETARLEARYGRALLMLQIGLYSEAVTVLRSLAGNLPPSERPYILTIAQALIGLNQHDEARAQLLKVSESSPYYRAAQRMLASDWLAVGKPDEAIKVLRTLVAARADDQEAANELNAALFQAGQFDDAVKLAESQLARLAPRTVAAIRWRLALASAAAGKHDWAGAAAAMEDAVDTLPERRELRAQLALYRLAAGQIQPAMEALAKEPAESLLVIVVRSLAEDAASQPAAATASHPASLDAVIRDANSSDAARLACILTALATRSDPQGVLKSLEGVKTPLVELIRVYLDLPAAKRSNTRQVCVFLAEAMIAQAYGLFPLADYFCGEANRLDSTSPLVAAVWLPVLTQLAKRDEAVKVSEAAQAAMGKSKWALELGVWRAMASNDYEGVIQKINAAEAAGPLSPSLMSYAASSLMRQGRLADALKWYERALAADPDNPDANNNVAYLLAEVDGDDPAALKRADTLVEKALSRSPNNAGMLETRGWIRLKRGDAKAALSDLLQAIEALRNDPRVHYHLGMCYYKLGQLDMARLHLANVAKLGGDALPEAKLADELLKKLPPASQPAASAPAVAAH